MGLNQSKSDNNNNDDYNILNDNMVLVNFIQLKRLPGSVVEPEQLNMLLGLNIPRYSIVVNTEYPYLFCVGNINGLENIIAGYGYQIGFIQKQKIYKQEYNSNHITVFTYSANDYYKLKIIR
jgi:hypothetical protein